MDDELRERLRRGDPTAFADPSVPLLLIADPMSATELGLGAALYLSRGGERLPWVLDLVRSWWQTETESRRLFRLLAALGAKAGRGSPEHRRAVRVACLCARTVPVEPDERELRALGYLEDIERWAEGDASVEPATTREQTLRGMEDARAQAKAQADEDAADPYLDTRRAGRDRYRNEAVDGFFWLVEWIALLASDARIEVGDEGSDAADVAARYAIIRAWIHNHSTELEDDETAEARRPALAELIRSVVPLCPVVER